MFMASILASCAIILNEKVSFEWNYDVDIQVRNVIMGKFAELETLMLIMKEGGHRRR
jgi:hypothetical protein